MVYLLYQAVHKHENSKLSGGMGKVGQQSEVVIKSPYILGISNN